MGCFLSRLLSRCFLSLSWLLSGTPSNSLGVFGTSLGSLLGLSRGSWGLSWALLGLSWAALWPLLSFPGPLLDSLGLFMGVPFRPCWPKRRQGSDKVPQDRPKSHPRDPQGSQNGSQKEQISCLFGGPFLNSLRDSFSEGFLDAWPLKIYDFAWEVLQKRCFPQVTSKSETKTGTSNEQGNHKI